MGVRRTRRALGIVLMVSSLCVGILAPFAATAADEVPKDRPALKIARTAVWNGDRTEYSNTAVTGSVPPAAVCLVAPQACFFPEGDSPQGQAGGQLNDLTGDLNKQYGENKEAVNEAENNEDPGEDITTQDSLPVSILGGKADYRSAVLFELPPIPADEQVDEFTLFLTQAEPTYYNESPALRRAVLAALTCARENDEESGEETPRCQRSEFEKIANECETTGQQPCLRTDEPLTVEVCPIVDDASSTGTNEAKWKQGAGQDEDTLPNVDCIDGGLGTPVAVGDDTIWAIDLTFAAQSWHEGTYPNNGVLIRPVAAENFAYGDPEATFNKRVTFEKAVAGTVASSEPPPPIEPWMPPTFDDSSSSSSGSDVFGSGTTSTTTSGGFGAPGGGFSSQPVGAGDAPAPVDAPAPQAAQPVQQTLAAGSPLGQPEDNWLLWVLLAAMFLGGGYLLTQSLQQEAVAESTRSGAMTRLLERRAAIGQPDLVTR